MRKLSFTFLLLFAFLCVANHSFAQLSVSVPGTAGIPSNWNVDSLVRNVMLGEGVELFNVKFNNNSALNCTSIGKFTTGTTATNLGISSGIIMGTGAVTVAVGPNNSTSSSGPGCSSYNPSDNPLSSVSGSNSINDCAILEFDFIPKSDSIRFRYVFASEEYPEFVNAGYNDVFGFFISGLNPVGSPYNNFNIALVPGTTTPISIDNVNIGLNSSYYVNNANGAHIQYDAFTTVLTAEAKVIPCTPYHMKLCIADLGDGAYDSGVFLEANSLSSNAIQSEFRNPANPQHPNQLYEGCCADIVLHRPQVRSNYTNVNVHIEGTASNGADFPQQNPQFVFPANTDSVVVTLCPIVDSITEGDETVVFIMEPADGCPDTVTFIIKDADPLAMHAERDELTSASLNVELRAVVTGGMPNRTCVWTNLGTRQTRNGETITVPTVPRTNRLIPAENLDNAHYSVVLEDFCYNIAQDTIFVGVLRDFATPTRDTIICSGQPLLLTATGADSCVWRFNNLDSPPVAISGNTTIVYPNEAGMYIVSAYAYWGDQWWEDIDTVRVLVVALPNVQVSASREEICPGESVTLRAVGVSSYSWDGGITYGTSDSHVFNLDTTTMLYVYGKTAAAECPGQDSILITVDAIPTVTLSGDAGICGGEAAELNVETDATSINWTSSPSDPTLNGQNQNHTIMVNPSVTTTYTLTAHLGVCTNSGTKVVAVEPSPVAIGNVDPKTVSLGQMEATFIDQSLNTSTRTWFLPDGTTKSDQQFPYLIPDDVDSVSLLLVAYNPYFCSDSTTVTVYVDHSTLWAPNAFTPDENANNRFEVKMNAIKDYHIWIYNRGGDLVFESTDPEKFWDGRGQNGQKCPQNSYVYFISAHKSIYPFTQITTSGTVLLIR